ncbi:hypothetical protein [Hymenobacter terricola]|nr:hypothetical protein [Hymenobacter terricola]
MKTSLIRCAATGGGIDYAGAPVVAGHRSRVVYTVPVVGQPFN